MTIALTAALILAVAGFLVLLDRRDVRDRAERQILLQRIQAPDAAVYEHAAAQQAPDPEPFPMSDEQLAEEEERRRVIQFIERHEG
jgi:hypothetical protein